MSVSKLISVIVTGGSSGLGRATAHRLAGTGRYGVVVADLRPDETALCPNIVFAETDITKEDEVNKALDMAKASFGDEVSVAVNCAGVGYARRTLSSNKNPHDLDKFATVLHVNILGTFNVLRLAASRMAQRPRDVDGQRGIIINTSSIAAYDGQEGQAAYAASKGAIVSMTLPCARDLAGVGVRVCTIAPGLFRTPLLSALPIKVQQELGATVPNPPRLGEPDEFAHLVETMIDNHMLNGEVVRLDGALRMPPRS